VVTVSGLVGFEVPDPKVVVHAPGFGIVATNVAQLAVADTPTLTVTVLLEFPGPPLQYMVKDQNPEVTICAGRFVKLQVVVAPGAIVHAEASGRVPID